MSQQHEENEDINFTQLVENLFLQSNFDSEQDDAAESVQPQQDDLEKSTKPRKNQQDDHEDSNEQTIQYPTISDLAEGALSNFPLAATSQSPAAPPSSSGSRRSSFLLPPQMSSARRRRSSAYNDYLTQSLQNLMSQQRRASQNRNVQTSQRTESNEHDRASSSISRRNSSGQDLEWAQLLTQGLFPEADQGHGNRKPSANMFGKGDEEQFRNAIMMSLQSMEQGTEDNDQAIIDDEEDDNGVEIIDRTLSSSNASSKNKKKSPKKAVTSTSTSPPYSLSSFPANATGTATQKRPRKPRKTKASKDEGVLTMQNTEDQDAEHLNLVESALNDLLKEGDNADNMRFSAPKPDTSTAVKDVTDRISTVNLNEPSTSQTETPTIGNKKKTKQPKQTKKSNDDNNMFSKELADIINSVVESTFQNFNEQVNKEEEPVEENEKEENESREPEQSQPSSPDIIEIDMVGKRFPNAVRSTQPVRTGKAHLSAQTIEEKKPSSQQNKHVEDEIDMFKVMQDAMALASKSTTAESLTEAPSKLSKKDKKLKSKTKTKSKKSKDKLSKKERKAKKNLATDQEIDLGVNIDEILDSTLTTKEKEASRRKKSHKRLLSTAPMLPMSSFTTRFPTTYRKALLSADNNKAHTPGPLSKSVQLSYQPVSELSQYFRPSSERFQSPAEKGTVNQKKQNKKESPREREKLTEEKNKTVTTERAIENYTDDQALVDDVVEPVVLESEELVPGLDPALSAETTNQKIQPKTRPQQVQPLDDLQIKLKKKKYAKCAKQVAKICYEKFVKSRKQEKKLTAELQKAEQKRKYLRKKEAKRVALEEKRKDYENLKEIVERGPPYPSYLKLKKNGEPKKPYRRLTAEEIARKEELNKQYFNDESGKHIDHAHQATPERISTMAPEKRERLEKLKSFQRQFGLENLRYSKVNILYDSSIETPVQREKILFHPPWVLPPHPPISLPSVAAYFKADKIAKKVAHATEKSKRVQERKEKRTLEAEKKRLRKQYKKLEKSYRRKERQQRKKQNKTTLLQKKMTASAANAISSLLPLLSHIPPENVAIINSLKALIAARAAVAIAKTKNDKKVVGQQVSYIIQQAKINITKALSNNQTGTGTNPNKANGFAGPGDTIIKPGLENSEITIISDESDAEKDGNKDVKKTESDMVPQKIIVKTEADNGFSFPVSSSTPALGSDSNLRNLVGDIFTKIASPLDANGILPIAKTEDSILEQNTHKPKRSYTKKKPEITINMPEIPPSFIEQQRKFEEAKMLALKKLNSPDNGYNSKAVEAPESGVAKIEDQGSASDLLPDTKLPLIVDPNPHEIESAKYSAAQKKPPKVSKPKQTTEDKIKKRLEAREEIVKQKFARFNFVIPTRHSRARYTSIMKRLQTKLSPTEFRMLQKEFVNERKRRWRISKIVKEELNEAPIDLPDGNVTNIADGELLNLVMFLFNKQNVVDSILTDLHKENEAAAKIEQMQKEEALLKKKIKHEKKLEKIKPAPKKPRKPGSGRKPGTGQKRKVGNEQDTADTPQPKKIKLDNIDAALLDSNDNCESVSAKLPVSEKENKRAQDVEKNCEAEIIGEFPVVQENKQDTQRFTKSTNSLNDKTDDFCGTLEATLIDDCLIDVSKPALISENKSFNVAGQNASDDTASNGLHSSILVSACDGQVRKPETAAQIAHLQDIPKVSSAYGQTAMQSDKNNLPISFAGQKLLPGATQSNFDKEMNTQGLKELAQSDKAVKND